MQTTKPSYAQMQTATILHFIDPTEQARIMLSPSDDSAERLIADGAGAPSFDHYEKAEHIRPPPPGIPFGYILEVRTCTCNACGRQQQSSRMFAVTRAGYGSATLGLGSGSPIFDRPIKRVDRTEGTPRCLWCIEDLKPEHVQYPTPGAAVGRSKAMAEAASRLNTKPATAPTKPADVASDFQ